MGNIVEEPVFSGTLGLDLSIAGVYELKEYYLSMEEVISNTVEWRIAALKKRASEIPEIEREQFTLKNHPYRWEGSFHSELRASILISGMSFLESQLINLCKDTNYRFLKSKKFEPPTTKILSNCRAYLKNEGKLIINLKKSGWEYLNEIYVIRNYLTHHGMTLCELNNNGKTKVEKILSGNSGISVDEEGCFLIEKKLCDDMFNSIENFLKYLRDGVEKTWVSSSEF